VMRRERSKAEARCKGLSTNAQSRGGMARSSARHTFFFFGVKEALVMRVERRGHPVQERRMCQPGMEGTQDCDQVE